MAEFKAFSPDTEVLGQAVLSIVDGMELFKGRAMRVLAENGISGLQADAWYRQQSVLNAFKTIFEKIGPNTVRTIGRKIPANAPFPPEINTLDIALQSIDVAYKMNHRSSGQVGSYRFVRTNERLARMTCENPYPCEMDLGLIEAMADRFRPKDAVRLRVDHEPGGPCRHRGDESCQYLITW